MIAWFIIAFVAANPTRGFVTQRFSTRGAASGGTPVLKLQETVTNTPVSNAEDGSLSQNLVESLDLAPMLHGISMHAGSHRGRQALLSLVGAADSQQKSPNRNDKSKRRRIIDYLGGRNRFENEKGETKGRDQNYAQIARFASSAEDAAEEYRNIEEALLALEQEAGLTYPPLYGADSSPWNTEIVDTDYDEWLGIPSTELSLENVLQAEQIVMSLLQVSDWAMSEKVMTFLPGLSSIGMKICRDELTDLYDEIKGAVEVVRVRTPVDPSGKSSFSFRLKDEKFEHLQGMYNEETKLTDSIDAELRAVQRKLKGSNDVLTYQGRRLLSIPTSVAGPQLGIVRGKSDTGGRCFLEPQSVVSIGDQLEKLQDRIQTATADIERSLLQSLSRSTKAVDSALKLMARLDVIFAKAAWGQIRNGALPVVGNNGVTNIDGFVHPMLSSQDGSKSAVPIDLRMAVDSEAHALIISGANGGGKTVALKSFGLVQIMCRLGIPVPIKTASSIASKPRVDFMDNLIVEVGDKQSVLEGESTLMARLNSCAAIIQRVCDADAFEKPSLVLLDEIGGGTDPRAGSAIAQAVLEELIRRRNCRVVATTHSPQLKALSLESKEFSCATVLLHRDPSNPKGVAQPTYKLKYGSVGDSHALAAAQRCSPALPKHVLDRAASLLSGMEGDNDSDVDHFRILTQSLERDSRAAEEARFQAEEHLQKAADCRNALLALSRAYESHFSRIENRLQAAHDALMKHESDGRICLVGETLSELRVVKEKAKGDEDRLRERGLKIPSDSYEFSNGESVVIITKGAWEGETGEVVSSDQWSSIELAPNEELVLPSLLSTFCASKSRYDAESPLLAKPIVFKRFELAIWDYDSVWEDAGEANIPITSVRESKRKLFEVFKELEPVSKQTALGTPASEVNKGKKNFTSARQRKASIGRKEKVKRKRKK